MTLDEVKFAGKALPVDLAGAVVGTPTLDLSVDQVGELALTVADPGFVRLASGLFTVGTAVTYRDLTLRVAAVETGGAGVEQVTVSCRSQAARALRDDRRPSIMRNVSATEYLAVRCNAAGITFVGQPTARRVTVGRTAPEASGSGRRESDWDVAVRLADEHRFWWGEDGTGRAYFGAPSWLAGHVRRWALRWPDPGRGAAELTAAQVPSARRSEDADDVATLTCDVHPDRAGDVRPFHALDVYGLPTFAGRYLITAVRIPLGAGPVTVEASWPVDPDPADAV